MKLHIGLTIALMVHNLRNLSPWPCCRRAPRPWSWNWPRPPWSICRFYLEQLKLWNARTNLTGLKTDRDIVIKHFLDSLAVLPWLDGAASLVDLGSGGGFPGLVLKLALPHWPSPWWRPGREKPPFWSTWPPVSG